MKEKITKTADEWLDQLTAEQFHVCRDKGTERPFSGKYHDSKEPGVYRCVCCGAPLFSSTAKFDSGTGWPSFYAPMDPEHVHTEVDTSHGIQRTEVLCAHCDAHLGHVFTDGPQPSGLRYCINSVSLELDKEDQNKE
jgi:peptide-methionine (R)-S-oxide reductase